MLQQQQANAAAANTTGRQAANSATNNQTGLINSGIKALGGLAGLFGGGSSYPGVTGLAGNSMPSFGYSGGDDMNYFGGNLGIGDYSLGANPFADIYGGSGGITAWGGYDNPNTLTGSVFNYGGNDFSGWDGGGYNYTGGGFGSDYSGGNIFDNSFWG